MISEERIAELAAECKFSEYYENGKFVDYASVSVNELNAFARAVEAEATADLRAERDALRALLPGVYYMDPPDGGDVDLVEQFRRMEKDAARYRWIRNNAVREKPLGDKYIEFHCDFETWNDVDAAIDALLAGEKP